MKIIFITNQFINILLKTTLILINIKFLYVNHGYIVYLLNEKSKYNKFINGFFVLNKYF